AASRPNVASGELWRFSGAAGLRAFAGTRDGVEPHISLGAQGGAGPVARGTLQLRLDAAGGGDFPCDLPGSLRLVDSAPGEWGPFAEAGFERNTGEALRARAGLALGARYAAALGHAGELEIRAGLAGTHGEWDRAFLDGPNRWRRNRAADDTVLNLALGLR